MSHHTYSATAVEAELDAAADQVRREIAGNWPSLTETAPGAQRITGMRVLRYVQAATMTDLNFEEVLAAVRRTWTSAAVLCHATGKEVRVTVTLTAADVSRSTRAAASAVALLCALVLFL